MVCSSNPTLIFITLGETYQSTRERRACPASASQWIAKGIVQSGTFGKAGDFSEDTCQRVPAQWDNRWRKVNCKPIPSADGRHSSLLFPSMFQKGEGG